MLRRKLVQSQVLKKKEELSTTKSNGAEDGTVNIDSLPTKELHPSDECLRTVNEAHKLETLVLGAESDVIEAISSKPTDPPVKLVSDTVNLVQPERAPAWQDEDDNEHVASCVNVVSDSRYRKLAKIGETQILKQDYQKRLKKRFEVVAGNQPAWADLQLKNSQQVDAEDEEESQLSRRTGDYVASRSSVLAPTYLDYKPVTPANKAQLHKAPVSAVRFHPTSQVIMTASKDQNLSFFQVDGTKNAKIQSMFIENFPIYCARFSADGCHVILASKRRSFYNYDMISGQLMSVQPIKGIESQSMGSFELSSCGKYIAFKGDYGCIYIISTKSKELVRTLKMNGCVNCLAFSHNGQYLYSFGDDAVVYVWEMSSMKCIHKFRDEGCRNGTSLSVDPLNSHIACGSEAGVVNIYDVTDCLQKIIPPPIKVINNLLTKCTCSRFNSSAQLLALASADTEKSVKMVNMSALSVYQNFPSLAEKMAHPSDLDFSPNSGYLACGTTRGMVHMYRLEHYDSY